MLSNLYTVLPILFPTLQSSLVFLTHYPGARCIGWPNFSLCVSKIGGDMVMKFSFQLVKLVRYKKCFTKDDFSVNCFLYSLICRKKRSSINKTKVNLVGDHRAIWYTAIIYLRYFDFNLQSYLLINPNLKSCLLIGRWVSHSRRMVEELHCYITLISYFCQSSQFYIKYSSLKPTNYVLQS